jgi:Transposase
MALPVAAGTELASETGDELRLFIGDDWAEDHHDVELMTEDGRVLGRARLPEGVEGMTRLHALVAGAAGDAGVDEPRVLAGIETDRGPWVAALVSAGYEVFAVNPLQAARYRERHAVSGAKSDAGDAHVLADMVRTDAHQLRQIAGDSALAEAVKVVTRMHKTLVWERTRRQMGWCPSKRCRKGHTHPQSSRSPQSVTTSLQNVTLVTDSLPRS